MYRDGSKGKAIFEDFTRLIEKSLKFHLSDRFQSGSALTTYSWRDASRKKMFLFPQVNKNNMRISVSNKKVL